MVDEAEISAAIVLKALQATHQLTKIYDEALKPAGLTSNQFSSLTYLYGAKLDGTGPLSMAALAEFVGVAPSALRRQLGPLLKREWITSAADMTDRRRRAITITTTGCSGLRMAVPFWRCARTRIREALGIDEAHALNDILDRISTKLKK